MADAIEQPTPADLTPLTEDLTATQIRGRRKAAAEERQWLRANADRNLATADRVRELARFIAAADEQIVAIESVSFAATPDEPEPAPAPEPEPVVTAPVAVVAPDPEPAPEPEPEAAPAVADLKAQIEEMERAISLIVASGGGGEGTGVDPEAALTPDQILDPGQETFMGVPLFATAGSGTFLVDGPDTTSVGSGTNFAQIANRMREIKKTAALAGGLEPYRINLARRQGPMPDQSIMIGANEDKNTQLLLRRTPEAMAASAQFRICGIPTEVTVAGCVLDSSTPFIDALAANVIGAENCQIRFRQPLDIGTVNPAPQLWTNTQQNSVVAATPSTWKPITTGLPACTTYCVVEPFDTVYGLRVSTNDQMCRADLIEEVNRWIEVKLAILLESQAMNIFDANAGLNHHYKLDAATLKVSGVPQLGAAPALMYGIYTLLQRVAVNRHVVPTGWTAFMHPTILPTIALDMGLAGENVATAQTFVEDIFRAAGINRIVWTKDFGPAEGALATGYTSNVGLCNIDSDDQDDWAASGHAFGAGSTVPDPVSDARIRLAQPENWYHGYTNIVDYSLMTSPELLRQNAAEYFGERRDFLFPISNCGRQEFVLDVTNLCPNGNRIYPKGELAAC